MGNSGSNKIHTKADSERMHEYNQSSLQRVNPKVYNGGFKVLPERLPNQRLRSTDNGNVLHNGGTLSGRRPTSVGGFPDIPSSPQPPPLPPPLTEEELQQLLKKRHRLNNQQKQQQHRHSSVDISDGMFSRSNYIPESTQSNIDFRLSKPPPEMAPKKKLFNRKTKAPIPPRFDDRNEKEQKKANNKKDFTNFFHSKRNSNVIPRETIDDNASYLLPPPSQFVSTEVVTAPKVHSVDKKSITYVLERREASVSPSSGHRSSLSGAERNHYVKRGNSPPENKYNGRGSNHHHQLVAQLSDSAMQSSTLDRIEMRHRMSEPLQKRVQSMDSLVQKEVDIVPHGQLLPTTRDELKEKLTKMSKTINHSMDNIYLLSRNNNNIDHSLPRKGSYLENKVDMRGRTDSFDTKQKVNKFEFKNQNTHHINKNAVVARESFKLHETKTMENSSNKLNHGSKSGDDDVFESPADSRFNYKSSDDGSKMLQKGRGDNRLSSGHQNRDAVVASELVSEHVQDAFLAKTREAQTGVLEYNRKLGSSKNNIKKPIESSQNHATPLDVSSEDDMDIDMQLRPTLPKRHHAVPRFSPTHVWRSLVIDTEGRKYDDRSSDHSSDAEEEGDIYEDRIQRVARPMAPPKTINEKSADSGISPGAVSPLPVSYDFEINDKVPHNKTNTTSSSPSSKLPRSSSLTKTRLPPTAKDKFSHNPPRESSTLEKKSAAAWTPEEDLASDFDAGSGDIPVVISELRHTSDWDLMSKPEMISSHPKLTTRKNMFGNRSHPIVSEDNQKLANKMINEDEPIQPSQTPQTFNSVRKLKRSLSGALQTNIKNRLTTTNGEPAVELKHKSLDDNWSLSRSLPNSLHNGHEGEKLVPYKNVNKTPEIRSKTKESEKAASQNMSSYFDHSAAISNYHFQPRLNRSESGPIFFGGLELSSLNPTGSANYIPSRPFIDLEGRTFNGNHNNSSSANNRVMYLPKYEAMQIIDEKQAIKPQRKAYSDLGMSKHHNNNNMQLSPIVNNSHNNSSAQVQKKGKKGKKFTYQSTVRQLERKQLEQQLSREVALEEKRRAEEVALVNKVEEEFQKKRDREKVSIRQQLRILNLKDDEDDDDNNYEDEDDSNDQEDEENEGANYKQVPELQSLPWSHSRNHVFSQSYEMDGPMSLPVQPSLHIPPVDYESISKSNRNSYNNDFNTHEMPLQQQQQQTSGKFFGGISRWMKKQPAKEEYDSKNNRRTEQLSRLEPEGAPSSLTVHDGGGGNPRQPSPQQESRGRAIVGAKFSSGRSPDISFGAAKKTNIYSHLAQVAAKEKLLQKTGNSEKDSRTSVWLSPDNTYPSPTSPSKIAVNGNNTYYSPGPFESLPSSNNLNGMQRDFHYYPHTGPSSMPYDIINNSNKRADDSRYSHGKVPNPQDWRLNGGQRHSIAIDTSSNSSRSGGGGGEWVSDGYRNNPIGKNGGKEKNRSANNAQNHKNERSSINSYQDYNPNGSDQRNKQNTIGLNSNQRSLSFSHIPAINKDEQIRSSRIPVPTLVQPFNPNKAYRPVPFYSNNSYENRK